MQSHSSRQSASAKSRKTKNPAGLIKLQKGDQLMQRNLFHSSRPAASRSLKERCTSLPPDALSAKAKTYLFHPSHKHANKIFFKHSFSKIAPSL
ncbi:hypothetical protein [Candidatus Protochlamydia phocaeensis]|uniref:hypothetical protein n=1 Tax=Candidatus Protochlamydia phocaeensis TaxID=1414722 RepID=UPI0008391C25|nr:hypothetical protein [Candidatus Protochlamydia phocaeensis]